MIVKLGILSGDILTLFGEVKGPLCVREIEVYLEDSRDAILMSLGSLLREGLVGSIHMNNENFYYALKAEENK